MGLIALLQLGEAHGLPSVENWERYFPHKSSEESLARAEHLGERRLEPTKYNGRAKDARPRTRIAWRGWIMIEFYG